MEPKPGDRVLPMTEYVSFDMGTIMRKTGGMYLVRWDNGRERLMFRDQLFLMPRSQNV